MFQKLIQAAFWLTFLTLCAQSSAIPFDKLSPTHASSSELHTHLVRSESSSNESTPLLKSASSSDIEQARQIVKDAIAQASVLNKARLDNPVKTPHGRGASLKVRRDEIPHLLNVTDDIAAAAALVAEADAELQANTTKRAVHARGTYWMGDIARKGSVPWGSDSSYKVFRNVQDYGAKGDGVTDDTKAIMSAMTDGKRCGEKCNGSTTKNAIVYFPPGTYLVSGSIDVYYGTQVIGDAEDRPVIKAAASFVGLGVFSTDKYVGGVGTDGKDNEWYVNTASFYRQIRNLIIDITSTDANAYVCALHYQVAQATSIQNLLLIAKTGTTQQGIYAENGSGGHMSDIIVSGGNFGFYGGAQQFTAQRMTFQGCTTAVQMIWDWGWLWKETVIHNSDVGFRLLGEGGSGNIGSVSIMDSSFFDVGTGVIIAPVSEEPGTGATGIALDNILWSGSGDVVKDSAGTTLLSAGDVDSWYLGPNYGAGYRVWDHGEVDSWERPDALLSDTNDGLHNTPFFEKERPSYLGYSASDFVHLKDYATGDGATDDTSGVQAAINNNVGKVIFADAGTYILTDTVYIPAGTRIVGETWTQFAAYGDNFSDMMNPRVMLKVGEEEEEGVVELQDLMFTTKGATPGAILVEWNIKGTEKGDAGMWDCHARIGGATGTELTPTECPALTTGEVREECIAATMIMHITTTGSGYFENVWLWVADHMVDDPDLSSDTNEMTQISVYVARGLLIESTDPVWLYGTASEHSTLYQYSFQSAENVLAGLVQTESPYYQPTPKAPAPFTDTLGIFLGDPDFDCGSIEFDGCDSSWGLVLSDSKDIYIAAAGIYSWFSTYSQDCIDLHECQKALVLVTDNDSGVRLQNLITIGAEYSAAYNKDDGSYEGILATTNLGVSTHPEWSQLTIFDAQAYVTDDEYDPADDCVDGDLYTSLDAIQAAVGTIPTYCIPVYTIPILDSMLYQAMDDYNDVNNGYDDVFGYYETYVKDLVQPQLDSFMSIEGGDGNKYFTCTYQEGNQASKTGACPILVRWDDADYYTLTYTLVDEEGFYTQLEDDFGIQRDWVTFGEREDKNTCVGAGSHSDCVRYDRVRHGYPTRNDSMEVTNPKDIITKAQSGLDDLHDTMVISQLEWIGLSWNGSGSDMMEVLSVPVSMLEQAIDSMQRAKDIGEQEETAEKNKLIVEIISAVLMVIPFAGSALGATTGVLLKTLGRILLVVGDVGTVALALKDIVENPDLAPLAIMEMLVGFGGGGSKGIARSEEDFSTMAKIKKAMSDGDISNAGAIFKKNDDNIKALSAACGKK
ncbi:hypothetical protein JX265_005474 [Neoarthrinium moseri]|uniref:Rhamnogalacturonase A/B/Epimerase-like pectate lyase domain-containing protein n=1 Tax=Neoarthrinium moseri TaxID=1658444 RepID=A0A9P9WNR1_9PEZI|nr:hypothetical protein JX265_005474 [Neoarthrinium moseri]